MSLHARVGQAWATLNRIERSAECEKAASGHDTRMIQDSTNLFERARVPLAISLATEKITRGIDNYHIDIYLSPSYTNQVRQAVEKQLTLAIAGKKLAVRGEEFDRLRKTYSEVVEVSLHRTKTDLKPEVLAVIQFGLSKFVVEETRRQLDEIARHMEDALVQQQQSGARTMLTTQEKLQTFRQGYSENLYKVCRLIFKLLQREESNELRALRAQYLDDVLPQSDILLFNPLLCSRELDLPVMLLECYSFWSESAAEFFKINHSLENFFKKKIKKLKGTALRIERKGMTVQSEVHDEMGALIEVQKFLGPPPQQEEIFEEFSWLDEPGNIRLLFDSSIHQGMYEKIREEQGFFKARSFRKQATRLEKSFSGVGKALGKEEVTKRMYAAYLLRASWTERHAELIAIRSACDYIIGIDRKKILKEIDQTEDGALGLVKKLDQLSDYMEKKFKEELDDKLLQMITDWSRYRLHLKCFRFAHRVYSRINVITDEEKLRLSRESGQLHELLDEKDYKEGDSTSTEIIRHTIIKADVRGSTTVTTELTKKNLNPASYFSQRFFEPINELLGTYGASKVFIEGDAIILSIYEHNNDPQQWFSVSRACGIAKGIIDIVNSRNAHARQMKLPFLEVGIGICFANNKPMFLYDEQKPIMISSAIGDADRMSSSSWKLRNQLKLNGFSVEVLQLSDKDVQKGEKGQEHIRYNVNGVLLDRQAFLKLKSELKLKRLGLRLGGKPVVLYVGSYPDVEGKLREIIVREGKVKVWETDHVVNGSETGELYHEVVTNAKINAQISGMLKKAGAA